MAHEYDQERFINDWATKILKCPPDRYSVAAELINNYRNFETAVAISFGLSFATHKEYATNAAKHWKEAFLADPNAKATPEYVVAFRDYYIAEVVPYPADA
jgi:hypothetical protein